MSTDRIERIPFDKIYDDCCSQLDRNYEPHKDLTKQRMQNVISMLKGESQEDVSILNALDLNYTFLNLIARIIHSRDSDHKLILDESNFIIDFILDKNKLANHKYTSLATQYISSLLTEAPSPRTDKFIKYLDGRGITTDHLIDVMLVRYGNSLFTKKDNEIKLTAFGQLLAPKLGPQKKFIGEKESSYLKRFHEVALEGNNRNARQNGLNYLLKVNPDYIGDYLDDYLTEFRYVNFQQDVPRLNLQSIPLLLASDSSRYVDDLVDFINKYDHDSREKMTLYVQLYKHDKKYLHELRNIFPEYLKENLSLIHALKHYSDHRIRFEVVSKSIVVCMVEIEFEQSKAEGKKFIDQYLKDSKVIFPSFLIAIESLLGEEAIPYLIRALKQDTAVFNRNDYTSTLFELLSKYDYTAQLSAIVEYLLSSKRKDMDVATGFLAQLGEKIIPEAKNLLAGKTVKERIPGALILSKIKDNPEIAAYLDAAVDKEKNDTTRNVMLDALAELRFAKPYSLAEARHMIALAEQRKKLSKWSEKFIEEEELPDLFWSDGTTLSLVEVRFLFYRMKQTKGLNSDVEARQVVGHIDGSRSPKFALHLLSAFVESGSDSKLKHYLTLTGLLGGDEGLTKLNTLFRKCLTDKRVKMAEYVLGAIAMIGSDKALRIIEVISRKYANKKPKLSKYAIDCLDAAAKELNITQDELADRIIPNFDFDGIFREFDVEGETYRAFVNADFKLIYYNENNKSRKSVPPAASKELKKEFREIAKEINAISKSQSGRLEKYMVEDRKWSSETWQAFFQGNPIMFVYAMKLVWSVYDVDNKFITGFYCDEDCSLLNIEDDEIELEEGQSVGIMHPLDLTKAQLQAWESKLYDMSMVTIFPTVDRPVFEKQQKDLDQSSTKVFFNSKVSKGADYAVSHMVKRGWYKSPGDGGSAFFTKTLNARIVASPNIEGPSVYYQGGERDATVFEVYFRQVNSREKITIKDIPAKWYSEVMADIDSLIKAT